MSKERLNFFDYLSILFIILIFAVISFVFQLNQKFSFDQTQMLVKGFHALFTGEYLPFGNEASTFGNLPGALSSFVMGFPFNIYPHAYSPVIFQILLRCLAVLFFANGLAQLFSRRIVLLGTFLFAMSVWTFMQGMLYNPAYLPLGACLFFTALVHLRNDRENNIGFVGRFLWTVMCALGVGWCIQFHMSWPVLGLIGLIMWIRRDVKISYVGAVVGVLIIAASVWPFVQEVYANPTLIKSTDNYSSDRYIGYGFVHVYPVLKGILYWLRFGSLLFTQKAVIPEIDYDEASLALLIPVYAWIGIAHIVGGITVIFALMCNYFVIFRYRMANNAGRQRFIRGFTISCVIAVIVSAGMNTLTLNFWQIAVVMPFALIPILARITQYNHSIKKYVTGTAIFLIFANIVAVTCSSDYSVRVNYRSEIYKSCLVAFTPGQCSSFSTGMSPEQIAADQMSTPRSTGVIFRVIEGVKPLPEGADAEYVRQYEEAVKKVRHYRFPLPEEKDGISLLRANTVPVIPAADAVSAEDSDSSDSEAADEKQKIQNDASTVVTESGDGLSGEIILK